MHIYIRVQKYLYITAFIYIWVHTIYLHKLSGNSNSFNSKQNKNQTLVHFRTTPSPSSNQRTAIAILHTYLLYTYVCIFIICKSRLLYIAHSSSSLSFNGTSSKMYKRGDKCGAMRLSNCRTSKHFFVWCGFSYSTALCRQRTRRTTSEKQKTSYIYIYVFVYIWTWRW